MGWPPFLCLPDCSRCLVLELAVYPIPVTAEFQKIVLYIGVIDWLAAVIRQKVLLTDVGFIAAFVIFSEQMIKGLFLAGTDLSRNGFPPLFCIGKLWINIKNDAAQRE